MCSSLCGPPRKRVPSGVLQCRTYSARSAESQVRRRSRPVSAIGSATERLDAANDRVDRFIDMLEMRAEAEDRGAEAIAAVDPRSAQHHPPFLLDVADQPFVEIVDVARLRQVAEGDDREVRRRARVPAV